LKKSAEILRLAYWLDLTPDLRKPHVKFEVFGSIRRSNAQGRSSSGGSGDDKLTVGLGNDLDVAFYLWKPSLTA